MNIQKQIILSLESCHVRNNNLAVFKGPLPTLRLQSMYGLITKRVTIAKKQLVKQSRMREYCTVKKPFLIRLSSVR